MSVGFPSNPQFAPQFPQNQPPRKSGFPWLISLLLVFVGLMFLGGVLLVGGIWYVTANVDRWLVGFGREAIVAMIQESEIPAQEKTEVIEQIDRVVTAYKERKINQDDLNRVLTELQESPALMVVSLYGIDEDYLVDSGLSEAEIVQGRRVFQRVIRGVYEKKIDEDAFYAALPEERDIAEGDQKNGAVVRPASTTSPEEISTDDLREAIAKLKVMADNAQIPDEPFQLDIGDEFKKAVDKALAGKNAQAK